MLWREISHIDKNRLVWCIAFFREVTKEWYSATDSLLNFPLIWWIKPPIFFVVDMAPLFDQWLFKRDIFCKLLWEQEISMTPSPLLSTLSSFLKIEIVYWYCLRGNCMPASFVHYVLSFVQFPSIVTSSGGHKTGGYVADGYMSRSSTSLSTSSQPTSTASEFKLTLHCVWWMLGILMQMSKNFFRLSTVGGFAVCYCHVMQ